MPSASVRAECALTDQLLPSVGKRNFGLRTIFAVCLYTSTYGIHQDVSTVHPFVLRRVDQQRRTAGSKVRQVETGARQVVFGLSNVHPEALQVESMKLLISGNGGEDFLFYRCRSQLGAIAPHQLAFPQESETPYLDSIQHARVEHVDTGVDSVSDEFDRLLDETVNDRRSGLCDHDTECGWLGNLGDHDGTFTTVSVMEVSTG